MTYKCLLQKTCPLNVQCKASNVYIRGVPAGHIYPSSLDSSNVVFTGDRFEVHLRAPATGGTGTPRCKLHVRRVDFLPCNAASGILEFHPDNIKKQDVDHVRIDNERKSHVPVCFRVCQRPSLDRYLFHSDPCSGLRQSSCNAAGLAGHGSAHGSVLPLLALKKGGCPALVASRAL
jgi:hypothetical protein